MIDFSEKLLEKKKLLVAGNRYQYLLAVTDNLNMELVNVMKKEAKGAKEIIYVYQYIDEFGRSGRPSTKYKTTVSFLEELLEREIDKGHFKIATNDNSLRETESTDTGRNLGDDSRMPEISGGVEQPSLFS